MTRIELEELLEAYALDLLGPEVTTRMTDALRDHPDLEAKAAELQRVLAGLAYQAGGTAPPELRAAVLDQALSRRQAGTEADATGALPGWDCYRLVAADVDALIADLDGEEFTATTIYRRPVGEMISHLSGGEHLLARSLLAARSGPGGSERNEPDGDLDPDVDHRAIADPTLPAAMPADQSAGVESWLAHRAATAAMVDALADEGADRATVAFAGSRWEAGTLLTVRAFELWNHGEDICRSIGRPVRVPPPGVLRAMAEVAVDLVARALSLDPSRADQQIRLTLPGQGGGSWVRTLGPVDQAPIAPVLVPFSDPLTRGDAAIVADVVEFCRLVADRVEDDHAVLDRQGDPTLVSDALAAARSLADFGAGPIPVDGR